MSYTKTEDIPTPAEIEQAEQLFVSSYMPAMNEEGWQMWEDRRNYLDELLGHLVTEGKYKTAAAFDLKVNDTVMGLIEDKHPLFVALGEYSAYAHVLINETVKFWFEED